MKKVKHMSLYANMPVGGQDVESYRDDCAQDLSCIKKWQKMYIK